ncbi:uncharacterized protein LOC122371746 isoform X3 [Amphibalanus amphitrite]|uniref:uncharacterized protein LOC122371746 isoform X3 n=1 Tax=Amphibalanus amphitrite TaxID=1232801 RepID=UPI001C919A8B|nr:uncharacterized protein LOC122371746 isoform X3 [Amphibalanus amphitrite]
MATRTLLHSLVIGAVLVTISAELDTGRTQKFHFKTATHYRKEYKDRDGSVYGEYGVHMPDGWTRVMVYETSANKLRLVHEYRTPTKRLRAGEGKDSPPRKFRRPQPREELDNDVQPEIQIIAVPQLWKVRGEDLFASASEQRPVTLVLAGSDQKPTLAPPRLTDQRALYNFGYAAPYHGHNETGTESGAKFGEYYVDLPNCWRSVVRYWADESGYHPTLRRMRTPGCEQQKREAVSSDPSAAADPSSPDGPSAVAPGKSPDPAPAGQPQETETPSAARSEPQRTAGRRGPSAPGSPSGATASCGSRTGPDGQPAAPSRPYGFAYNAGTHYHWERGFANGTKIGAYAVQLPDGTLRTTTYTADCSGFKPSITVEPLDEAKFLRDFQAFNPPKEAKLFERGEQPQASALVRSEPAPAPQNLRAPGKQRSAEVRGTPPRLVQERRKETTSSPASTKPPTTTERPTAASTTTTTTTTAPPTTTAAPPRTSASPSRPIGGSPSRSRSPARRLAPIVPIRPAGSGPYHFYVHLRHNYHEERGYENGTVAGQYGVVGPDGVLREVGYTSEHGFVPTLTDTPVSADHDLSSRPRKL